MDGRIGGDVDGVYVTILDQAIDGVVSIDGQNCVTSMNAAAERLWGISAADVAGRNVRMPVPAFMRAEHDGMVDRNRRTGEDRIVGTSRDIELERADGSTLLVNLSMSKVTLPEGQIGYTALIRDASERADALAATRSAIGAMGEASEKIADYGRAVQELAQRTNLLARNASIEAARVGEAGRSFGVVAVEVRRLADSTRGAADDIGRTSQANRAKLDDVRSMLDGLGG